MNPLKPLQLISALGAPHGISVQDIRSKTRTRLLVDARTVIVDLFLQGYPMLTRRDMALMLNRNSSNICYYIGLIETLTYDGDYRRIQQMFQFSELLKQTPQYSDQVPQLAFLELQRKQLQRSIMVARSELKQQHAYLEELKPFVESQTLNQ